MTDVSLTTRMLTSYFTTKFTGSQKGEVGGLTVVAETCLNGERMRKWGVAVVTKFFHWPHHRYGAAYIDLLFFRQTNISVLLPHSREVLIVMLLALVV